MLILSIFLNRKSAEYFSRKTFSKMTAAFTAHGWVGWPKNNQRHGLTSEEKKIHFSAPRGESFYSKAVTFVKVLKQ
jgi:hypothetical protein